MNRVKMNAKHEYEYIANFKVMQNVFKAKKIDRVCHSLFTKPCLLTIFYLCKPIPIEKLVKCKMQYVVVRLYRPSSQNLIFCQETI